MRDRERREEGEGSRGGRKSGGEGRVREREEKIAPSLSPSSPLLSMKDSLSLSLFLSFSGGGEREEGRVRKEREREGGRVRWWIVDGETDGMDADGDSG